MGRKIYIDLDNTLIDTIVLAEANISVLEKCGGTREQYDWATKECIRRWNLFNYERVFWLLREALPDLPTEIMEEMCAFSTKEIFFEDSLDFLKSFDRSELVLVTQGEEVLQLPKILAHKLEEFFDPKNIHILTGGPKSVAIDQSDKPIFLVDDSPATIHEVRTTLPDVICIRVHEPPPWELPANGPQLDGIAICQTLTQAKNFINLYSNLFPTP